MLALSNVQAAYNDHAIGKSDSVELVLWQGEAIVDQTADDDLDPLPAEPQPSFESGSESESESESPPAEAAPEAHELAGNRKLSDAQVVEMRVLRAESLEAGAAIDWPELGERFGVHWKTAYRICLGFSRDSAGGPIEPRTIPEPGAAVKRCSVCGAKCQDYDIVGCILCQCRWMFGLLRVCKRAGIHV